MSDHPKDRANDPSGPGQDAPVPADLGGRRNGQARLRRLAREIIYRTPEVRPEKVARLKEAIAQGAYEIDAGKLADIMIAELIRKR
ncbi:MAG: flagellar biosynthesis anti-sigma factor FlgM [Desulfobaccales bacterium]|jgi:flagellar biosynthesis anti-sigma factor FlgM